jgi:hypothetical protein
MAAGSSAKDATASEILGVRDEQMGKIVEEVDRFFRSVHANIEDWKFSMEDDADGTRIFVRFQIHISSSTAPPAPKRSPVEIAGPGTARTPGDAPSAPGVEPSLGRRSETAEPGAPLDIEAELRSDPDLALFIEQWRHKRENRPHGEFHKAGAPFVEPPPRSKGRKRARDPSSRN